MSCDYLVVGCGMFGAVYARVMAEHGRRVLLIDKRRHIGGNCYTERVEGIDVHRYGAHIFHTSDVGVWQFVNRFARFNHYRHHVKVNFGGRLFSFPINLMTLHQLWGIATPEEAQRKLAELSVPCENPLNLEEWILAQVGREIYEIFVQGYTAKQWGRHPRELPASIIRRLPIRTTYDDHYFSDTFEGIPVGGYTTLFENMLDHPNIRCEVGVDFFAHRAELTQQSATVVYTGKIDEFFDYRFGSLAYRSLRFEQQALDGDFQGNSVVNYTAPDVPYTRIIEHKHFAMLDSPRTIVTYEYPDQYDETKIPYYPIRDEQNAALYERYRKLAGESNVIFGGRLGTYRYYDMHQVVAQAKCMAQAELQRQGMALPEAAEPQGAHRMHRNLIVCPIGANSCHRTWIAGPETPNFDLFLIYYGDGPDTAASDAKYYERRKGFKFELLRYLAQEHRGTLEKYDHIWCPDDDIACNTRDINLMFDIFQRYRLRLAQPAVAKGDVSYRSLIQRPGNILRYTPFVEVMCPLFACDTFFELSDTFLESRSAWGLDWVWAKRLTPKEMGIIDKVGVHHTRSLGSGEHYGFLRRLGINPLRDFHQTLRRHGGIDYVLFNRIRHGRVQMKRVVDRDDRRSILRRVTDDLHWRLRKRRSA